ncbi:MAG: uncharacterized protein QG579_446 [Patescibacteria group bacterium]|jgi:hypothetical protein|nr:uncharacterized protein [Patescibacteria group bacterium]
MTGEDIINLIKRDKKMMSIIFRASDLGLKDWFIGAGFVRNKVWDYLHGIEKEGVETHDIDLVYFDPNGNNEYADDKLSQQLKVETGIDWELVNQSYAHVWKNLPPYTSTEDAITYWPETATCIGVTLDEKKELKLIAPYGIDDLVNLRIRMTPKFPEGVERVKERVKNKKWLEKWPKLKVTY